MNLATSTFLLFAPVLTIWFAAGYLLPNGSYLIQTGKGLIRSKRTVGLAIAFGVEALTAGLLAAAVGGWQRACWLGVLLTVAALLSPFLRFWCRTKYYAELEVAINLGVAGAAWALIHFLHLSPSPDLLLYRFGSPARNAAYLLSAGLFIFLLRGGTHIVRGILDRGGTMPPGDSSAGGAAVATAQAVQLRHGRLIGNVERLILALLVANGQYTSLAFFFAAKGLIRSKELEDRRWVDYLLLGSLSSFLVAVVIGLLVAGLVAAVPAKYP